MILKIPRRLIKKSGNLTGLCLAVFLCQAQTPVSKLAINISKPGHAISPVLYNGMLLEEIGQGIDGGFYAQLIRNNSFEDNDPLAAWSVIHPAYSSLIPLMFTETNFINAGQRHCLRWQVRSVDSEPAGLANEGFWGMRLDDHTSYKISFYARKDERYTRKEQTFQGSLTIQLESHAGKVFARSDSIVLTDQWKKYSLVLTTSGVTRITGDNRFVIYSSAPGTIDLDMVSMMPPTYKNHSNGLRIDLAEMQSALHPKMIRFPGGCDVEHTTVDSGWNWKKAIGPVDERPGEVVQHWHYRNSQQFALDEMFQMCEDWGAEPIYCASMSIDDFFVGVPVDKIQPFVQDLLDLIEYANGDALKTDWGKRRAANGHPAPYHLKYVEIGNENGTTKGYPERYAIFYKEIKEKYPDMHVIINDALHGQKADIIDEHIGGMGEEMQKQSVRYDKYGRKGPKIVVGEYNTRENDYLIGNLKYAISDAAFLTGCERNSDIVISTTYSTLSANVHFVNWNPNLYYNDAVSAFGNPCYYMQKMFVENTGDVVLSYTLSGKLYVAPSLVKQNGDLIIKVVNTTDSVMATEITLQGAKTTLYTSGEATILTSASLLDENSLAVPRRVFPVTRSFVPKTQFTFSFPAHSVTVLRMAERSGKL